MLRSTGLPMTSNLLLAAIVSLALAPGAGAQTRAGESPPSIALFVEALVPDGAGPRLARVPAWRAFWFGWYAQFPETLLFK